MALMINYIYSAFALKPFNYIDKSNISNTFWLVGEQISFIFYCLSAVAISMCLLPVAI
jgi:hypothetical protein